MIINKVPRDIANAENLTIRSNFPGREIDFKGISGVYIIRNIKTNRLYIGSSLNLYVRYKTHINNTFSTKRKKYTELYNDMRSNPLDFIFCFYDWGKDYNLTIVRDKEQMLLNNYFAKDDYLKFREITYNNNPTATMSEKTKKHAEIISNVIKNKYKNGYKNPKTGYVTTETVKQNIKNGLIKSGRIKKIFSYDLINKVEVIYESIREAAEFTKVDRADIARILKGKAQSAKGFIFCYEKRNINDLINENKIYKENLKCNHFNTHTDVFYTLYRDNIIVGEFYTKEELVKYLQNIGYIIVKKTFKSRNLFFDDFKLHVKDNLSECEAITLKIKNKMQFNESYKFMTNSLLKLWAIINDKKECFLILSDNQFQSILRKLRTHKSCNSDNLVLNEFCKNTSLTIEFIGQVNNDSDYTMLLDNLELYTNSINYESIIKIIKNEVNK